MSETVISVADAAKDFLSLLELVETKGQSAVLLRAGKRIATLTPVPQVAQNCVELAAHWLKLERLDPDDAEAFAADIELARATLPAPKTAWD